MEVDIVVGTGGIEEDGTATRVLLLQVQPLTSQALLNTSNLQQKVKRLSF
jgi:hypothetical protein